MAQVEPERPIDAPTSPLLRQLYEGRWPDQRSIDRLTSEHLYQTAVQSYLLTIPVLNMIGLRDGSEATFGKGYQVLPIWKDRMDGRTLIPTPNCDVSTAQPPSSLTRRGNRTTS
jgi:hypothetical protein